MPNSWCLEAWIEANSQLFRIAPVWMVRSGKNGMRLRWVILSGQENHQDKSSIEPSSNGKISL